MSVVDQQSILLEDQGGETQNASFGIKTDNSFSSADNYLVGLGQLDQYGKVVPVTCVSASALLFSQVLFDGRTTDKIRPQRSQARATILVLPPSIVLAPRRLSRELLHISTLGGPTPTSVSVTHLTATDGE